MTATRTEATVITDDTPTATVLEVIEARTRRLMAERSRIECWGLGRKYRAEMVDGIDASLDEWIALTS